MRDKKPEEAKGGCPEWLATYGDMVTLVLVFFVLLFSMSSLDVDKFQAVAAAFSGSPISLMNFGGGSGINSLLGNGIIEMPVSSSSTQNQNNDASDSKNSELLQAAAVELKKMASDFETYFSENNIADKVIVEVAEEYVRLRFPDGILFDVGKGSLRPNVIPILNIVAEELMKYPQSDIRIEGHTDSDPINSPQFPSNWHLSSFRATSVGIYLIEEKGFSPDRVVMEGFGEYKPIAPNDTAENKAKNRRVEIKVYSKYFSNVQE